jgi:hypothetical protein
MDNMEVFIEKSYDKIAEIFATEKGRKFIQHFIRAFLPINSMNMYLSSDKLCSITGKFGYWETI